MSEIDKLDQVRAILENPAVELTTSLADVAWDSMAILSVIAAARANGKVVTNEQAAAFKTVADVVAVL